MSFYVENKLTNMFLNAFVCTLILFYHGIVFGSNESFSESNDLIKVINVDEDEHDGQIQPSELALRQFF